MIQSEQGQDPVKLVRDYENSLKKVASYKNHLRLKLHCKNNGIVPASLQLLVQRKKADMIIERAEKALLG